jgi:hypothetical protein
LCGTTGKYDCVFLEDVELIWVKKME